MDPEKDDDNLVDQLLLFTSQFLVISFSIICYFIFTDDWLYPWIFFILSSIMSSLCAFLNYHNLSEAYPTILYPDEDYIPTKKQKYVEYFVIFAIILSLLGIVVLSGFYIVNFNSIFGVYIMHLIYFNVYIFSTLIFLREATSDYSGHAYHSFRQTNNPFEKIPYSWFPSTLPKSELKKFREEKYIHFD